MTHDMRRWRTLVETSQDDQQWFAGSKIIDDDGQPLMVHHFTYNEFQEFDRLYAARHFKRDLEGIDTIGLWFTDNPKARYVNPEWGGRRMDVHLAIRRPLYLDDFPNQDAWSQLVAMIKEAGGSTALRHDLKGRGYDGIVLSGTFLDGVEQNVIVAFDPEQVRIVRNTRLAPP